MTHNITKLSEEVYVANRENGFYEGFEGTHAQISEKLLLAVSEITEALEELRSGHYPAEVYYSGKYRKPEGFGIEVADALIRLLDLAGALGLDIGELIDEKLTFNAQRGYKHGREF